MLNYTASQRLRQLIAGIAIAQKFYNLLRLCLRPSYREDGLATCHNCDFLKGERFKRAYSFALEGQPGTHIRWRAHVVQWAGSQAMRLDGDFVECGVNRAFLSTCLMAYVDFRSAQDRHFYLFDTFSGLVPELISHKDKAAYRNRYEDCYDFVRSRFENYRNVTLVRGVVPDTLSTVNIKKVAYLSIDMNCAEPELKALQHFWPNMVSGGVILLDDYGFSGHEAQKDVADEFAASVGVELLSLPTGQGLIIK